MDTDYEAWNGERYVWPPPDDWYLAADGRWWAEGTGPGPAARGGRPPTPPPGNGSQDPWQPTNTVQTGPGAPSFDAEVRTTMSRPVGEDQTQAFNPATGSSRQVAPSNPMSTQNPLNTYDPTSTQNPLNTYDPTSTQNPLNTYDPTSTQNPLNTYDPTNIYDPTSTQSRPGPYTSSAAYGTGATTAVADRTMVAPAGYAPEAQAGGGILEEPPTTPVGGSDKASVIKRNPALVAAGGLIVVAMVIAGYLMTQSGGDGSTLQSPSDLAESSSDTSLPATDDAAVDDSMTDDAMSEDSMTDDAMVDDAMTEDPVTDDVMVDDAMTEDPVTDDVMVDDAMTEGTGTDTDNDGGTGEETTAVSEQDAVLIDQFRTKLDELEITAAALSSGELLAFGQTACGYAQNSASLDEYTTTRDDALAAAQNEELGSEELSLVVDAAVTVFCADDAGRIGLELPTAAPATP